MQANHLLNKFPKNQNKSEFSTALIFLIKKIALILFTCLVNFLLSCTELLLNLDLMVENNEAVGMNLFVLLFCIVGFRSNDS